MHAMHARTGALFLVGLAPLVAGCVESTWTYTLNPDGSGKVELDALLQPLPELFKKGGADPFEDDPDELAKKVAGKILAKSKGVAAWKDVSQGIAGDGRVTFKGTAYFGELAKLEITGDPFPTSFLRPKLSEEDGGRLVLGLQVGEVKRESTDEPENESPAEPESEPTEDEVTLGVRKGKVAYQTIKPVATAFLSTMRTEFVIRPPGEAVEVSNFERREDGSLHLVFDGPRLLATLDDLAEKDAAKWHEFFVKLKEAKDEEKRPEEELLWELNRLVFGERGPVRAVVVGETKPLFDYEAELAEAKRGFDRLIDELGADTSAGAQADGSSGFWAVSGGVLASARTDSGTGAGWTALVGGGGRGGVLVEDYFGQIEVSRVGYEEEEGGRCDLMRVAFGGGYGATWCRFGAGLALSFGEGDIWALGPQALAGVGFFGRHAELHLTTSAYLWLGERDDEFDVDVEADVRLVAGVRF